MPADRENGDFTPCIDYRTVELRVIAFMLDNSFEQQQAINRRERTVKLMTGRIPREPEMQRLPHRG